MVIKKIAKQDTVELVTFIVTLFFPIIYLINDELVFIFYPILCIALNIIFLYVKKKINTFLKISLLGIIALTPFILQKLPFEQIAMIYSFLLFICCKIKKIDFEPFLSYDNIDDEI